MLRMRFELFIGKFRVPHIVRAEWDQSRDTFVQEFSVVIPYYKNIDEIKYDDEVVFRCGYEEVHGKQLPLEFFGKVFEIGAPDRKETSDSQNYFRKMGGSREGRLVQIKARDPLYDLHFVKIDSDWLSSTEQNGLAINMATKSFIQKVADTIQYDADLRYDEATVNKGKALLLTGLLRPETKAGTASLLYALSIMRSIRRNGLGLDIYWRDWKIVFKDPGDPAFVENGVAVFVFGQNIISDDLFARPGKDVKVTVRGYDAEKGVWYEGTFPTVTDRSKFKKGDLSEVRLFNRHEEAEGEFADAALVESIQKKYRALNFDLSGVTGQEDAHSKAQKIWEDVAGGGFQGEFTTFGWPRALTSNAILIHDKRNPLRTGMAIVNRRRCVFDWANGNYRQVISPGHFPQKIYNGLTQRGTSTTTATAPKASDTDADKRLMAITFGGQTSIQTAIDFAQQARDGKVEKK